MTRLKFYALTALGYVLALAALGVFASVGIVVLGILFSVGLIFGLIALATSLTDAMRRQRAA
ncbi:hypothetical protein [Cognatishimia sp.]|uniref:hypothetical protein n=1 Tax=Cognatishimia sp. TaxID=2211648 RepID=UPI003517E771|nr:hypothetical protein [Cognatishimia sp.]